MKIKYFVINGGGGSATAAINRCNFFTEGHSKNGVKSYVKLIGPRKCDSNLFRRLFVGIDYFITISFALLFSRRGDVLIFYGHFPFLRIWKYLRHRKYLLIAERNEYPSHILFKNDKIRAQKRSRSENYLQNLNMFDGLITCTHSLEKFYTPFLNSKASSIVRPSIVNTSQFECTGLITKKKYITYCGDWGNLKDGVPILIKAFSLVSEKFNDFKLRLIGGTSNSEDEKFILTLIEELNLSRKVVLEGKVKHALVPKLLNESMILVLARPSNKQAEGGFPSKVTEYMATGVPTLVTRVGEIEKYFQDNIHLSISEPDTHIGFAEKLVEIIENYSDALIVAEAGKLKNKDFDYVNQSQALIDFLNSIKTNFQRQ
ncbi:glycosyltransferase family 4 protein [Salegentibacter sp. BDJ18]|uniref:glycosyltransferase family 4 protein n=1 Tax=Salegentibacter sp. BDJ18 TaxID=2816376 RepID=UPI001AAEAB49|nr:glycosyltransferase family 4 protein [Salegentibacter sp. BDJ18]MBO2542865.1 glycosyltransferase family 4 protein [Salegentibacter sp. BDJ18]